MKPSQILKPDWLKMEPIRLDKTGAKKKSLTVTTRTATQELKPKYSYTTIVQHHRRNSCGSNKPNIEM